MRNETETNTDRTFTVTYSVPWCVCEVNPLKAYSLYVKFVDGTQGFVDLSHFISSENAGVFTALRDPQLFKSVYINHGAVTWPGELDLAPDTMYDVIKDKGEYILT